MKKRVFCLFFLLGLSILQAGEYVADPFRAVNLIWPKYPRAEKDFWLLLTEDWHRLKGISQEEFVKNSGVSIQGRWSKTGGDNLKNFSIREITCLDESGQTIPCRVRLLPGDKETVIQNPQALTDKDLRNVCIISGSIMDISRRYDLLKTEVMVNAEKKIHRIRLYLGPRSTGKTAAATVLNGQNFSLKKYKNHWDIELEKASDAVNFELQGESLCYHLKPFSSNMEAHLKKVPFMISPPIRLSLGNFGGLKADNIDHISLRAMENKFRKNFMGYVISEWDSNFLNSFSRPTSSTFRTLQSYIQLPCNRDGMIKNMKTHWNRHTALFGSNVFGMSGMNNFEHLSLDFGGKLAALEITSEHITNQHRNNYAFLRGAARQFNVPSMMYFAYFLSNYTCDSRRKGGTMGLDYGAPPSLSLRNFYIAYYMGCNYIHFECQPYGQVRQLPDGNHILTENGKAVKNIFEWSRRKEGIRGESYAPVLLLTDRTHGYDAWYRYSDNWKAFYNLYPVMDDDLMLDYVMQTFNPNTGYVRNYKSPAFIGNLRNSSIGDIFDVYIANPRYSRPLLLKQLERYPVVMLTDDINWTAEIAENLKKYTANGGTLVLTAGHLAPFLDDPAFMGGKPRREFVRDGELEIQKFDLNKNTQILMKGDKGNPLVIKNKYGNGHVLLITSPFMKKISGKKTVVPPQLRTFLENIQREVLPFEIQGDCQYLFNIMPDKSWKIILINNRGIMKGPGESVEKHDKSYTRKIRIVAPAGTAAAEIRNKALVTKSVEQGKNVFTLEIAPAQIMVVELSGLKKLSSETSGKRVKIKPVTGKKFKSMIPVLPNDGFLVKINDKNIPSPQIIGSWNAKNNFKSTVGSYHLKEVNISRSSAGVFAGDANERFYTVTAKVPFHSQEGSWHLRVKTLSANEYKKLAKSRSRNRFGIVYSGNLWIEICDGFWQVGTPLGTGLQNGPAVTPGWHDVVLSWKNGFGRFFIDGKEIFSANGPIKFTEAPGINSFYRRLSVVLGRLGPYWPANFNFAGEIESFVWYGRHMMPEELKKQL